MAAFRESKINISFQTFTGEESQILLENILLTYYNISAYAVLILLSNLLFIEVIKNYLYLFCFIQVQVLIFLYVLCTSLKFFSVIFLPLLLFSLLWLITFYYILII